MGREFDTDMALEMVCQWRKDIHMETGEYPGADATLLAVTFYFQLGCLSLNLKDALRDIAAGLPSDDLNVTIMDDR